MATLNRTLARLAVVEAMTNFNREPFPTLAGPMIFDSKIEPSETFENQDPFPIAVVYTDYDKDFMVYRNKLQDRRLMTITIEFLVVQARETTDADGSPAFEIDTPLTDSELEMSLDYFEEQTFRALQGDAPAAACFQYLVQGYENVISRRGAAVTSGQRLSARQVTIECNLLRDPNPGVLAPAVAEFLDRVEEFDPAYAVRAGKLRQFYQDTHGLTGTDFTRWVMGLSKATGAAVGYEAGPEVRLGTPIVFMDPQRRPL